MRKLFRDRWNKKISGICGGLGYFLNVDPSLIRILFIIMTIITGVFPLTIGYLIATLIIPLGPSHYIEPQCKKLFRSRRNRQIGGVCGGLAQYLHLDPSLIRILYLVLALLTGVLPLLILYIAATFIIPEEPY